MRCEGAPPSLRRSFPLAEAEEEQEEGCDPEKSAFKSASVFAMGSSIEALAEGGRIYFHATNYGHKRVEIGMLEFRR